MNRVRWSIVLPAVVALALLGATGRVAAAPTFTLVDADISIDSSTGDGSSSLLLKADGLTPAQLNAALGDVSDLLSPLPPPMEIKFTPNELPQADGGRRWALMVAFKGLPRGATQKRYLSFSFQGQKVTLPYTMTNKSTAAFSWSIKNPPAEVSLKAGEAIDVGIAVQAVPATHVRVMHVTLIEQSRKTPLDAGILLCDKLTGTCDATGLSLTANSANRLWLRTSGLNPIVGKYAGAVTIGADQKPDGETMNLTVYGTTLCRQLAGVAVILFGVACAWYASTFLQSRLSRAQALLPARLLTDRAGALLQILKNAPPITSGHYQQCVGELTKQRSRLKENELDGNNLLPPKVPLPYKGMEPNVAEYKKLLAEAGARIAHLDLIINQGFASVWKRISPTPTAADATAINAAMDALDDRAGVLPLPDATEMVAFIKKKLAELDAAMPPPPPGVALAPDDIQPGSFEELQFKISQLSGLVWLVFGGLATAVGSYILVFSNLGFGVCTDYLSCLFWGFGLPAGSQLMQSTIGSVGTALSINVPKAG